MDSILVFLQKDGNSVMNISLQVLNAAKILSLKSNCLVNAVMIGTLDRNKISKLGLSKLYHYQEDIGYSTNAFASIIEEAIRLDSPKIVLIGGTYEGRAVAPIVATYFNTGITADCTKLDINENGFLSQVRPAFSGNLMAEILTENSVPQIATVKENSYSAIELFEKCAMEVVPLKINLQGYNLMLPPKVYRSNVSQLENADIVMAVGRGVKNQEQIERISRFACKVGGVLGSSRALVEKGLMPTERQIGLSGKSIAPKLLITFGISGSTQFLAGVQNAKKIIAINNDENAPICSYAHYVINEDLCDVLEIIENEGETK